jgi:hypothetical protein
MYLTTSFGFSALPLFLFFYFRRARKQERKYHYLKLISLIDNATIKCR